MFEEKSPFDGVSERPGVNSLQKGPKGYLFEGDTIPADQLSPEECNQWVSTLASLSAVSPLLAISVTSGTISGMTSANKELLLGSLSLIVNAPGDYTLSWGGTAVAWTPHLPLVSIKKGAVPLVAVSERIGSAARIYIYNLSGVLTASDFTVMIF